MQKYMKFAFIICFLLLTSSNLAKSQTWGCAEDPGGCGSWTTQTLSYTLPDTDCLITCEYRYRICGGVFQWEYKDVVTTGNCAFMQNFNYLHYNFSSINELLDILILADFKDNGYIGTCPTNTTTAQFYSASCGIWLYCEYDIEPQTPRCEQGYDNVPTPGPRTVKTWKWQSCGTTCCKRTYVLCKEYDSAAGGVITKIKGFSKEKIGNCTQEPGGSSPKYARPCEDGC